MPGFHFIGVGGVGMAGLAALMKARGARVTGCDLHQSPRTEWLQSLGVDVFPGHSPEHVSGKGEPPTVVVTPAVPADNAEFAAARKCAHVRYRGELLAEIVSECDGIAVCGTHGKTTTSTFAARLLAALGEDPGWCIGGAGRVAWKRVRGSRRRARAACRRGGRVGRHACSLPSVDARAQRG